jgi:hypothetical protein
VVSRRLAREELLSLKVRLAGDVESELQPGSAGGREVIIINSILVAAPSGLSPKQAALQRNAKTLLQDCGWGRLPDLSQARTTRRCTAVLVERYLWRGTFGSPGWIRLPLAEEYQTRVYVLYTVVDSSVTVDRIGSCRVAHLITHRPLQSIRACDIHLQSGRWECICPSDQTSRCRPSGFSPPLSSVSASGMRSSTKPSPAGHVRAKALRHADVYPPLANMSLAAKQLSPWLTSRNDESLRPQVRVKWSANTLTSAIHERGPSPVSSFKTVVSRFEDKTQRSTRDAEVGGACAAARYGTIDR